MQRRKALEAACNERLDATRAPTQVGKVGGGGFGKEFCKETLTIITKDFIYCFATKLAVIAAHRPRPCDIL